MLQLLHIQQYHSIVPLQFRFVFHCHHIAQGSMMMHQIMQMTQDMYHTDDMGGGNNAVTLWSQCALVIICIICN